MTMTVIVNPADVTLADIKAKAAELEATVVGNPFCPRGQMFIVDPSALGFPEETP